MTLAADYYMPVKSVLDDAPITGDIRFYQIIREQIEGLRLMVNERVSLINTFYGFSYFTAIPAFSDPLKRNWYSASNDLSTIRTKIGQIYSLFVNTTDYTDGDIDGVAKSASFCWASIAEILADIGVGVSGNYTLYPSRNIWGYSASGGTSPSGKIPCFKEHINETLSVVQKLTHLYWSQAWAVTGCLTNRDESGGTSWKGRYTAMQPTRTDADTAFAAASYGNIGYNLVKYSQEHGSGCRHFNFPGTFRADLTTWSGGTTKIYLSCDGTNYNSPPITQDGNFHLESEQSNGGTYTTSAYGSDAQPSWGPAGVGIYGWTLYAHAVIAPDFDTYP